MEPGTESTQPDTPASDSASTNDMALMTGRTALLETGDLPVERLKGLGPIGLSDHELLSILIGKGRTNESDVDPAKELLSRSRNDLVELGRLSLKSMAGVRGIGMGKAAVIAAALELGRRRLAMQQLEKPVMKDSASVARFLQARFRDHTHEVFVVVFLNRANRVIHVEVVSVGGMTGTVADPRVIVKRALEEEAVGLILCHNHP